MLDDVHLQGAPRYVLVALTDYVPGMPQGGVLSPPELPHYETARVFASAPVDECLPGFRYTELDGEDARTACMLTVCEISEQLD